MASSAQRPAGSRRTASDQEQGHELLAVLCDVQQGEHVADGDHSQAERSEARHLVPSDRREDRDPEDGHGEHRGEIGGFGQTQDAVDQRDVAERVLGPQPDVGNTQRGLDVVGVEGEPLVEKQPESTRQRDSDTGEGQHVQLTESAPRSICGAGGTIGLAGRGGDGLIAVPMRA